MSDKSDRIYSKIKDDLDSYTSFEDKNNYLKNHKYLDRVYEKYPDLEKEVNSLMIENITSEFGIPESKQFSFSKDVSNRELLRTLDMYDVNQRVIEKEYGGEKGKKLRVLSDKSKKEFDEVVRRKGIHRENIATMRQEFDDRVGPYTGGPMRKIPFLGLVLPEAAKYFTQIGAGWTDWFQPEGMEKIETRMFNWDPVAKRYGPGPEIESEQSRLQEVLDLEDSLKEKYEGVYSEVEEFNELEASQRRRSETITGSGIDEALDYISMDEIKELLGK
jgi:hypothetical protein|tara:strand:- start:75 stop:899 length:825 start_codon:yes stop_codon:yes gene_type:complete